MQPIQDIDVFQRLSRAYKLRLEKTVLLIEALLKVAQDDLLLPDHLEEMKTIAHGMAGTGGTFGFNDVTACGRALDEYVISSGKKEAAVIMPLLEALHAACVGAVQAGANITAPADNKPALDGDKKPLVLVIDDDQEILDFLRINFTAHNFAVEVTSNGATGVEVLSSLHPDLIILDIVMPEMNGHQVLDFIKANEDLKKIPVIMLTSQQQNKDIFSAFDAGAYNYDAGAYNYVVKPFRAEDIIREANDLLAASRKTILIIESDPLVLDFVEYTYADRGFKVVTAANGLDGWRAVQTSAPDLIVLDWLLPNLDAVAFLRNLRQDEKVKSTPVILLANSEEDTAPHLAGAYHITKPFIPRDLLKKSIALMGR